MNTYKKKSLAAYIYQASNPKWPKQSTNIKTQSTGTMKTDNDSCIYIHL